MAQNLELMEEAVRQRLSRGRKLLREEVLAFVEVALEKTSPGKAFTVAVVAALPVAVTSAKAASIGVAVAKGGAGAKGLISLGALSALGSLVFLLGANFFSWKTMVDDSKSAGKRRFMVRMARYQVVFFAVTLGASFSLVPLLFHRPWVLALAFALLILAIPANAALVMPYIVRKRVEIQMGEGTFLPQMEEATRNCLDRAFRRQGGHLEEGVSLEPRPGCRAKVNGTNAVGRTIKLTMPLLIMLMGMAIALPWRQHWLRCAILMAAEALVIFWFFCRMLRTPANRCAIFPLGLISHARRSLKPSSCSPNSTASLGAGGSASMLHDLRPSKPGPKAKPSCRANSTTVRAATLASVAGRKELASEARPMTEAKDLGVRVRKQASFRRVTWLAEFAGGSSRRLLCS